MTRRSRRSSLSPASATVKPDRRQSPQQFGHGSYSDASVSSGQSLPYQTEDDDEEALQRKFEKADTADGDDEDDFCSEPESVTNPPIPLEPIPTPPTQSTLRIAATASSLNYAANYVNVAPIPIFRGGPKECPSLHLSRFEKVCRANNASSMDMIVRIFPVSLEGEALLWFDLNIEPYPSLTWEEIKSSFVEAYGKINLAEEFRSELMMINQAEDEPVRSYFLRLQWILTKWKNHGLSDCLIKGIFVDGLREDFQRWVMPQKPSSLDDALRLAFDWEQVRCVRSVRRNAAECEFCGGGHEERDCEIRERTRELWPRSSDGWNRGGPVSDNAAGEEASARSGSARGRI